MVRFSMNGACLHDRVLNLDAWLPREEAIELRDLLLREFPVNSVPVVDDAAGRKERRERIATAVLGGIAANPAESFNLVQAARQARPNAQVAVVWADALIAALDEEA